MTRPINKRTKRTAGTWGLGHSPMAGLLFLAMVSLCAIPAAYAQVAASKEEAGEVALKQVAGDGKVLSIEEEKPHFKVKVLVDGKVSVVIVIKDPASTQE